MRRKRTRKPLSPERTFQEEHAYENDDDCGRRAGDRILYLAVYCRQPGTTNGRIHKSSRDKKLAGVCGGIAEWLGVDPMIIRLAWAALILGWGSGLLAYIVCALVLPEETGAAEEE